MKLVAYLLAVRRSCQLIRAGPCGTQLLVEGIAIWFRGHKQPLGALDANFLLGVVVCHEYGTTVGGFLPGSWTT